MEKSKTRLLTKEELSLLQKEERLILKEIDRICRLHDIPYYIVGGTLLGAVRHGGFIPWDDDIDIAMYRRDYNRFKKICKSELNACFFLQDTHTDPGYNQLMPKVRKNGTLLESLQTVGVKMHKGVFVDIFLLDYVKKPTKIIKIKHDLYWKLLNLYMRKQSHNIESSFKRKIVDLIPAKWIVKVSDFVVSGKKEKGFTVNYTSRYGVQNQTFPSDYYGRGVEIQFDDMTVIAPCRYKSILERIYGDYMALPPEEKRGIHHKICDFRVEDQEKKA